MATQYRRMKYLDGIMTGDKDTIRELVRQAEKQAQAHLIAQRVQDLGAAPDEGVALSKSGTPAHGGAHHGGARSSTSAEHHEPPSATTTAGAAGGAGAGNHGPASPSKMAEGRSPAPSSARKRPVLPREVLRSLARTHVDGKLIAALPADQLGAIARVVTRQEKEQQQRQALVMQRACSSAYLGGGGASPRRMRAGISRTGEAAYSPRGRVPDLSSLRAGSGALNSPRVASGAARASSPRVLSGRSIHSPRGAGHPPSPPLMSPRGSVTLHQLTQMPSADLQLHFTRPTLKIPGCPSPRGHPPPSYLHHMQSPFAQGPPQHQGMSHASDPSSPGAGAAPGAATFLYSPRLRPREDLNQSSAKTSFDVATALREHQPLSARQKSLDYAAALMAAGSPMASPRSPARPAASQHQRQVGDAAADGPPAWQRQAGVVLDNMSVSYLDGGGSRGGGIIRGGSTAGGGKPQSPVRGGVLNGLSTGGPPPRVPPVALVPPLQLSKLVHT